MPDIFIITLIIKYNFFHAAYYFFYVIFLIWAPSISAVSLRFSDYPVKKIYKGDITMPTFKGRDKAWREHRTRISEAISNGPDYAGEITVIQIGCGTGCSWVTLGNVRTGQLYEFPLGGEENDHLEIYTNQPANSWRLAGEADGVGRKIANWNITYGQTKE